LLVEDNRIFRHAIRDILLSRFPGLCIREAGRASQALDIVQADKPHLIVMDINLPGENGLHLIHTIKDLCPEVEVIVVTSHDTPEYRAAAEAAGAGCFMGKDSLTEDQLSAAVVGFSSV